MFLLDLTRYVYGGTPLWVSSLTVVGVPAKTPHAQVRGIKRYASNSMWVKIRMFNLSLNGFLYEERLNYLILIFSFQIMKIGKYKVIILSFF